MGERPETTKKNTTMPPKKTKEAIAKAAASAGSKGKKKKWSKAKSKEKLQNAVLFEEELYNKVVADVPKQRVITPSKVSEHNSQLVFTRLTTGAAAGEDES